MLSLLLPSVKELSQTSVVLEASGARGNFRWCGCRKLDLTGASWLSCLCNLWLEHREVAMQLQGSSEPKAPSFFA